ncbi:Hypothetical predicted protein [Olea europaea subsp. europaea]|uniref:Uncharacterized protein n=1 Tax=Olea europaea subsp. europaea TaxID=158383 RepID=A0A8S0PEW1_OLEEU|nr:Hypothetical predicted protein [Olea europaea subsp. europaea]
MGRPVSGRPDKVYDDGWDVEDHEWLLKLLAKVEANADDYDDAMVVREAITHTKIEDTDVDDCVILDGDLDKLLTVDISW